MSVAILAAGALPCMLGMSALVCEGGAIMGHTLGLQIEADSGAYIAALDTVRGYGSDNAQGDASRLTLPQDTVTLEDMGGGRVRVTVSRPVPLYLAAALLRRNSITISASAEASADAAPARDPPQVCPPGYLGPDGGTPARCYHARIIQ